MVVMATAIFAQSAPLSKGDKQLNFGLGFSGYGLPLYVGMDFAFHNDWTAGPVIDLNIDDDISFGILGRVDYHWNRLLEIPSDWDFYLGAHLGTNIGNDVDFAWGLQLGGRWYWSDKWGLNLEFGGGSGYGGTIGVSMKL
jgi:hypothetical protein